MPQKRRVTFKNYNQEMQHILPPSLEDLINVGSPVYLINEIIEKLDLSELHSTYEGGGCSSYNPKLLLKVIVYGYLNNIYSSRNLEKAVGRDIEFMYLANFQRPSHNTINRFRGKRLKNIIEDIFKQIVLELVERGYISLEKISLDGTKIEANANKYTFTWKKMIQYHRGQLIENLKELMEYCDSICKKEEQIGAEINLDITSEEIKEIATKIKMKLSENPKASPRMKEKAKKAVEEYPERNTEYLEKLEILGERNSYSKTDNDATFMRTKEDNMRSSSLKPCYNLQISTTEQVIVNYSLHQNAADTTTLAKHLTKLKEMYGEMPREVIADAGYGSEENYQFMEEENIIPYVKYNTYSEEKKEKNKKIFDSSKLFYNEELDFYVCPMGQRMFNTGERKKKTDTGYEQRIKRYEAQNYDNCPLKGMCNKKQGNRIIERNERGSKYREKAKRLLDSEKGIEYQNKRRIDVETVFGNIKRNKRFRQFNLRGLIKCGIEMGLICIAHNLTKLIGFTFKGKELKLA